MTGTERMLRRLRWGVALVLCAPPVLLTLWLTGAGSLAARGSPVAVAVGLFAVAALLAAGHALLVAAARAANGQAVLGAVLSAAGTVAFVAAIAVAPVLSSVGFASGVVTGFVLPGSCMLAAAGALLALIGFIRALAGSLMPRWAEPSPTTSARRARAGAAAVLGLLTLLAVGAWESLVLSPEQMAPHHSLQQVYSMLTPADRSAGISMVVIWIVFWGVASLLLLALCLVRGRLGRAMNVLLTPRRILVFALLIGSVVVFFQGWSGFSLGMSISDTVPPMAGGRSWQGQLLTAAGAAMFVAAVLLALLPGRSGPAGPEASASLPAVRAR